VESEAREREERDFGVAVEGEEARWRAARERRFAVMRRN
jgi:hypothetical protein